MPITGVLRRKLSSIAVEQVHWLWRGRIALGKLILYAGDPGEGKSTVALDIAARLSRGAAWPDGHPAFPEVCSTLIFSAEDGAADTLRPRAEAAGADLDRVHVVDVIRAASREGELIDRGFNLTTDIALLEESLRESPDVKLVILDPVSSYLGQTDTHRNADVRVVLAPLAKLAEDHRCAVLMITHLNKGAGSPQHRITGSIAFNAAARISYLSASDPDDDDVHLFLPLKNNLAAKGRADALQAEPAKAASRYAQLLLPRKDRAGCVPRFHRERQSRRALES